LECFLHTCDQAINETDGTPEAHYALVAGRVSIEAGLGPNILRLLLPSFAKDGTSRRNIFNLAIR
jgi:hypothetical protein